jgi:hypothetical protein
MQLCINTVNWEDGSETNFPDSKVPELHIEPGTKLHDDLLAVINRENKETDWSSIVAVILQA